MNREIFTIRKHFLEEFFKNRANFIISSNYLNMISQQRNIYNFFTITNQLSSVTTNMFTPDKYNLDFVKEKIKAYLLYFISMLESGEIYNMNEATIWRNISIYFRDVGIISRDYIYIMSISKDLLNVEIDNFFTLLNQIIDIHKDSFTYITPSKPFNIEISANFRRIEDYIDYSNDDEEYDEAIVINTSQIFKLEECVICLSTNPNILFCNCGHLCLCKECNEIKNLKKCPICKTKNTILRIVE